MFQVNESCLMTNQTETTRNKERKEEVGKEGRMEGRNVKSVRWTSSL